MATGPSIRPEGPTAVSGPIAARLLSSRKTAMQTLGQRNWQAAVANIADARSAFGEVLRPAIHS